MEKITFDVIYEQWSENNELQNEYIKFEHNAFTISHANVNSLVYGELNTGSKRIKINDIDIFSLPKSNPNESYIFKNCNIRDLNIFDLPYHGFIFDNCNILNLNIECKSQSRHIEHYKNIIIDGGKINKFNIKNSILYTNIHINHAPRKIKIKTLNIQESIFEQDISFYKTKIQNIEIKDCDFNSLFEFHNSTFKKFNFEEISFKGLCLFDLCTFKKNTIFEHIIFEKLVSFRGSTFRKALNLDYTSSEKEMNFYDVTGLENGDTSQETYRIIKYNFEQLNNRIEANRYHALELKAKKADLEKNLKKDFFGNITDYLVFTLHDLSSEHSTNWFRALLWIFFTGFITTFSCSDINFLITIPFIFINIYIFMIADIFEATLSTKIFILLAILSSFIFTNSNLTFNEVFKHINILSKVQDFGNSYIAMTLNKVSLGYLYYQFIVSIRKDTRK